MIERILSPRPLQEDIQVKIDRPDSFDDFIGQEDLKENMQVYVKAAVGRKDVLDHTLLSGPPGLGKTTFAQIIAHEMGGNFISTSAPVIEKPKDMASLLSNIKKKDILFIDEIHRLKPIVEEILYSAMEDCKLDIKLGNDTTSNLIKIDIEPFTLIGATTKAGALTKPLVSRFGIIHAFDFYTLSDLEKIVSRNGSYLKLKFTDNGVTEIARRSRGTPRILNRLLKRIRDYADVLNKQEIDKKVVDYALNKMNIDAIGLGNMDIKILSTVAHTFEGGPVGIENLATSIGEDASSLEDVYEPYLIQIGFLKRTSRGRVLTSKAYKHIGLEVPAESFEDKLF